MQNSQENIRPTVLFQQQIRHKLFETLYLINQKYPVQKQIHCAMTSINSIIVLLVYLSLKKISLFQPIILINNQIAVLIMFSVVLLILFQFALAILYQKHLFIKIQFLVYKNIVYPIALASLIVLTSNNGYLYIIIQCVAALATILLLGLEFFIGKESYCKKLIIDEGLPITLYLLIFQIFMYLHQISPKYQKITIVLMIIISLACRFGVINLNLRRSQCLEYTLFRIQSSLNLIYVAFLTFEHFSELQMSQKEPFIFIFPLIFFIIAAEFFHEYSNIMSPLSSQFFNETNQTAQFFQSIQYIADDLEKMANIENQDITQTCLIPFYYEHIKNCKRSECSLTHEIQPHILNQNMQFKALCLIVFRITEQLFINIMTLQHENVSIKLALLKFYVRTSPNKVKIMQLAVQAQAFNLSWSQRLKIYSIKRFVSDIDVVQFLETMKTQDSFQNFNYSISTLMRFLIEFWTQFLEDRVDFQKVLQISERVTPIINSIEDQVHNSIKIETFSTIRVMRTYSDYSRWILNDEMKSATISEYTNLLSKKISEIHEINNITADVQIGLVAISLNVKKLGDIKIANSRAAHIFNYAPQQFEKLSVNNIMPDLFARHHDEFLKAFLLNVNKKVNNDRRLLLGKKKDGHVFQIYLQLQKSAITSSQQLIFIANIQLVKKQVASVILLCDEKGEISNINSTYQQLFHKSLKKTKNGDFRSFTNIQELIPNFFDIVLDQRKQPKETIQCYDNPVYGIIEIKFEISKIVYRQFDVGYIVKGQRLINENKQHFFKHLSLTESLVQLADDRDLKGMKVQYSPDTNQYIFHESLDIFGSGQFISEFTIPYVKLEFLQNILTNNIHKSNNQYDFEIKTIRYCNDHFERVEQMQSFESEISQQQKRTINNFKFSLAKQKLQKEEDIAYKNELKTAAIVLLIIKIIWLTLFYVSVSDEKKSTFNNTYKFVDAYDFRSKISQYVLFFQVQDDPIYGQFFSERKINLKSSLINSINEADIPQNQKERALKIVYLEQTLKNTKFQQLINDETLFLSTIEQIPQQENKFIVFEALFAVLIIVKLLFNFGVMQWHQYKIIDIFSLFLGLSQRDIKACHKKCVQFLKQSSEELNEREEKLQFYQQETEETEQQGSHTKIKRFKNTLLGTSTSNFLRLNVFTIVFVLVTASMILNTQVRRNHIQMQRQAYQFVSTVMPEFSTNLMKIYSQKNQNINVPVKQSFAVKSQTIDYKLASYQAEDAEQAAQFISIMFDNQCQNSVYDLPNPITCDILCDGVMIDGVSKAINYLSHRMAYIQKIPATPSTVSELNQLSILLYFLIQPNIIEIKQVLRSGIEHQDSMSQIEILLYFIILLCVAICNTIYQCNYPLDSIHKSVVHSKLLISLIPQLKKKSKNGYTSL